MLIAIGFNIELVQTNKQEKKMFNNRYQFFSDSIIPEKEVRVTKDAIKSFEDLKLPKSEEVKNSEKEHSENNRHQMGYLLKRR